MRAKEHGQQVVTSDGALLVFVELALDEAQDEARLADGRLAEQDQFELADLGLTASWPLSCGHCWILGEEEMEAASSEIG